MEPLNDNDAFEAAALPLSRQAMAARPKRYLDDLNPAQRAAVEAIDGPLLMLAGAGTGKTKALMARVAHIRTLELARPDEILAVTFTNKAAREMKERLSKTPFDLPEPLKWMGTFHALSCKILRHHAELVGLKPSFTILDTDDQLRLLKQLIEAARVDVKRWPARFFSGWIEKQKNNARLPHQVPDSDDVEVDAGRVFEKGDATAPVRYFNRRNPESGAIGREVVTTKQIYRQYQDRLKALNSVDFGDLTMYCVAIFKAYPDVLAQYQRWFKYILVDEYQDTNVCQYLWLRLLAQAHRNICCVGDDDQSIYGWRGAEVGNILRFEKDFPGAKVIRLEQNYRSTPHILAAASGVISANASRLGKTLWTEATEGEKVRLIGHWDGEEEARWIGEEVEAIQRGTRGWAPVGLNRQAILVRASHQMRAFEDRFLTIGLPYRVIGGPRFYERQEIRDAMAYFRLAVSPDDDLAFERVVNLPKRGLGDKAVQSIQREARSQGLTLLDGARSLLAAGGIGGKGANQLRAFCDGVERWHAAIRDAQPDMADAVIEPLYPDTASATDLSHVRLAEVILEESGYVSMWQNDRTPEAEGRLENLKELVKALEQFDSLQGFLEHVALIMDNDSEDAAEKVSIMTLHAAKGLEFPVVFLPGWEDGLFPSQRSMDESGLKGIEEERRLAYVGITRAEELCTISFASNRRVYGQWQSQMPSRFIDELPAAHVEVLTPPGLMGGGYGAAAASFGSSLEDRATKADVYNSPGWRRLQERQGMRPVSQPREARNVTIDLEAESSYTVGERVFHVKFGYGRVTGIEGDKLDILFDKAGEKKIVARFVMPADIGDEIPF
ncbi:UvrD-helicase domain-containing protein [Rhodobacter sp. Har01]|uniref:ATP-dependent helicase n=1 Tax=Rhodobacter sp. Har01 TaxID=2883999 RepID=UPI001D088481|nr:UvrD-helicase domain-containing protein [Rhodobacter sp. Har01]MCB6178624.1 UvrD-helicase domain-containing protein [Rhodobacter sp. Har01]